MDHGVRIGVAVLLLLCAAFLGLAQAEWTADQEAAYRRFHEAFDSGAGCSRLFDLRKQFRVPFQETTQEIEANAKLRSVGCLSADSKRKTQTQGDGGFTVKEYRIYRAVVDAPMSISESQAYTQAANRFKVSVPKVKKAVETVQRILAKNGWFATPDSEMRHASDWAGERE